MSYFLKNVKSNTKDTSDDFRLKKKTTIINIVFGKYVKEYVKKTMNLKGRKTC